MVWWENHRAEGQRRWIPVLALLLTHCVTLDRALLLSGLSFLVCKMGAEGTLEELVSKVFPRYKLLNLV